MFYLGGHLNKSPCIQVSTAQGERGGLDYKGIGITEEESVVSVKHIKLSLKILHLAVNDDNDDDDDNNNNNNNWP